MHLAIRVAERADIPEIIQNQGITWQDHFLKERNVNVPMMERSERNMEYYMDLPGACLVALDRNRIVGSIISHVWGGVGWFGPLEVNPVCQGRGIGKALVAASLEFLRSKGCSTIGCETMAGSAQNIAFYSKMGFRAKGISNVLFKRLGPALGGGPDGLAIREGAASGVCRPLWEEIWPGLDYGGEIELAGRMGLGKVWSLDTGTGCAHAIVHTYEMFDGSPNAIIKLLVAGKGDYAAASALLAKCEEFACAQAKTGMFIRTYDPTPPELGWFFERGYEMQGASVRLLREGRDENCGPIHVSCWSG
jgi:ribosomal protein S18 acetylase RimI-like enzyme